MCRGLTEYLGLSGRGGLHRVMTGCSRTVIGLPDAQAPGRLRILRLHLRDLAVPRESASGCLPPP